MSKINSPASAAIKPVIITASISIQFPTSPAFNAINNPIMMSATADFASRFMTGI